MKLPWIQALPLLLSIFPVVACRSVRLPREIGQPAAEKALDWTLGSWSGVRRDVGDGSEGVMHMQVATILGGAGQTRSIEIDHEGGTYRGFCLQVFAADEGVWQRTYVNDVRRSFARLDGVVEGTRSVWRSVTPGRTRESRLVSERPEPDLWVRTMAVSSDEGVTWREMWRDELRREP